MGSFVKTHLANKFGIAPNKVFHVTVMPCFDKKLEASRETFKVDNASDVDMVITAVELEQVECRFCQIFIFAYQ
jgi:iron only hydrogenase large subunit-like protein